MSRHLFNKVCFTNCNSIINKLSYLEMLLTINKYTLICMVETYINVDNISDVKSQIIFLVIISLLDV